MRKSFHGLGLALATLLLVSLPGCQEDNEKAFANQDTKGGGPAATAPAVKGEPVKSYNDIYNQQKSQNPSAAGSYANTVKGGKR